MFRTARKILAEVARVALGPSWVEEEYVNGLIRCARREDELRATIAEQDRTITHLRECLSRPAEQ